MLNIPRYFYHRNAYAKTHVIPAGSPKRRKQIATKGLMQDGRKTLSSYLRFLFPIAKEAR
jgi:hypothetical protein